MTRHKNGLWHGRSLRKTICLDLVQLYGLDLVHHLCPRRAYGPLSLDLVQGIKLDQVQSWCISHTNLVSSLRPSGERDSSQEGRFYDGRQIRQKQPKVQDSTSRRAGAGKSKGQAGKGLPGPARRSNPRILACEPILLEEENVLRNRDLLITSAQSASDPVSKCQNDTLKCTLEELAVVNILKVNAKTKQEDIATQIGKSLRTVKRIMASLSEKGLITRENGKRNGIWVVKTDR